MRWVIAAFAAALLGLTKPPGRHVFLLGRSEHGRPIRAIVIGDPAARRTALVVGCVHGNERAGIAVADRLAGLRAPPGTAIWILRDANPDGVAAATRGNADGVDLNRNFPWRWRPLGGTFDAGPQPLSEPESRLLARLVRRIRPVVSVWFHQHLGLVDASGGDLAIESRYARLVGLPVVRLTRFPGSAVGWENRVLRRGTAFVVELRSGALSTASADRYARAIVAVAR